MPKAPAAASMRVSKTTLSMFLRTRCDKELFFSLHDSKKMDSVGLPIPLKRPGIGVLSVAGDKFELIRNDQMVRLFPSIIKYAKSGKEYSEVDLINVLGGLTSSPALILQGRFSVGAHQTAVLSAIGIPPRDVCVVPPLADFIPDVVYVRDSVDGDLEVRPDGTRVLVDAATENRLALSIIDIKHTAEANPSYCSEIAIYALMMANWLQLNPQLATRFFVSANSYLWTRYKQANSTLESLESSGGATQNQLLDALIADSENAQLQFYLTSIRRFFEDIVRVVRAGQARPDGWKDLDWHVAGACGSCDWLGDKRHMSQAQRQIVDANPTYYCMPLASSCGHLCLVPGITRGAKKVLCQHAIPNTTALATAVGHQALQLHTVLKREAKTLPARSVAIISNALSRDPNAVIGSMVSSANLLLYASVNFDSSSGLLTGLALSGVATNFTKGQSPRRFQAVPFVVDQKDLQAEWVALEGFLTQIATFITAAEAIVTGRMTAQIQFWEERQFQELCNAMGRHLPRVMALSVRKAKALAWVFSPEEMIATPDSVEAATVVVVDEIVRRMVFTPTRHVLTLFDTAEHYHSGFSQSVRDPYYREYLSNGIPRERIYEIWANVPQVHRGANNVLPRNTVIAQYSDALVKQSKALESICEQLRGDYRGSFRANATTIPTSVPQGARNVAFDGKLWIWWDELEFNTSQLEAHIKMSMDGERLEADYEAIILTNGKHIVSDEYEFNVGRGSLDAKFKEDSILTLGKLGYPGMPLLRSTKLLKTNAVPFNGNPDSLLRPFWSVVESKLLSFDRLNGRARVQLRAPDDPQLIPYLIANAVFPLLNDVFLLEKKKPAAFNWAKFSSSILAAIGNPRLAVADPNAARAMGMARTPRSTGSSPETPASRVLWNPGALCGKAAESAATAGRLAAEVGTIDGLDPSQQSAVAHAIERALTVIWGPPGTGKTKTLGAILHATTKYASAMHQPVRVLVTGPTYKAVQEVMERTAQFVSGDTSAPCKMFMGYTSGRTQAPIPAGLNGHVAYRTMQFDSSDAEFKNCLNEIQAGQSVTIVGCQVRQARRFPQQLSSQCLHPIFDVVVIDESSQVTVSQSLAALTGLKDGSRLIIAGDYKQMPPISSVDPPAEAAYLVGSIQCYLTQRPFSVPVSQCILDRNYRSNDDIVAYARAIGYPPQLQSEYPNTVLHMLQALPKRSTYPAHLPWLEAFDELLRPNTKVAALLHRDDTSSQGNRFEAQAVAGIVWMLRHSVSALLDNRGVGRTHAHPTPEQFWKNSVGIVTPHRAQRAVVIRELEILWPNEKDLIIDAVDTVERFQGGERHTIIVTFGVADVDVIGGEEAFLMQLERTNVAISRAMAKCIVVMPDALAAHIPEDNRALATAYALKDYVEEFCNCRVDSTLSTPSETRWAQVRYRS